MKKHIYSFLSLLLLSQNYFFGQGGYGEVLYPHLNGGTKMSSAFTSKLHLNAPGYVMAGYQPISNINSYNFKIDRTDQSGDITNSPWVFQKGYKIYADLTNECNFKPLLIENCAGVSIIETDGPVNSPYPLAPPLRYAVVGAFRGGCFFSLLAQNGIPLYATSFIFPTTIITEVTKPIIVECKRSPGEYIVCGSYNKTMYAFRINSVGTILWSQQYAIVGSPKDMLVSPYGPNSGNELVIVGKTEIAFAQTGIDGFFMKLDMNNGNVTYFDRIQSLASALPNNVNVSIAGNNYFNTITLATKGSAQGMADGFFLGGFAQPINWVYPSHGLIMRLDTDGVQLNTVQLFSPLDSLSGEVVDLTTRLRLNSNIRDLYALVNSSIGMRVVKMTAQYFPFFNPALIGETYYNIQGKQSSPCAIDFVEDPSLPDAGIQVFGTDDANVGISHYAVKSYFSGESGCSISSLPMLNMPPPSFFTHTILTGQGLTPCENFHMMAFEDGSFEQICGPYLNIAGASNARMFDETPEMVQPNVKSQVIPNPASEQAQLQFEISDRSTVNVYLYNNLGQMISILTQGEKEAGAHSLEMNLQGLNLTAGIYFIHFNVNGAISSQKFIYAGN